MYNPLFLKYFVCRYRDWPEVQKAILSYNKVYLATPESNIFIIIFIRLSFFNFKKKWCDYRESHHLKFFRFF